MAEALATKYRPKTFDDVTEQDAVKTILLNQLSSGDIKHAYLFCGGAGTGKAQPLYSKVLTPDGYIPMWKVTAGTQVITRKGEVAKVTGVYPQGKRPIYEITLQDRTKIRVADNHLNSVYVYNQRKKKREDYVLTTTELIQFIKKSKYKVRIDTPSVDFARRDYLIHPYLLGALIGDGSLHNNFSFSNSESDILFAVNLMLNNEYEMHLQQQDRCTYAIVYNENPKHNGSRGDKGEHPLVRNYDVLSTLRGQLDRYGLLCKSVDKHIPKEYLLNTKEVRRRLLQGLFDTDGHIDKQGVPSFSTSSKQLSDDFAFLVRSLGIRDTVSEKHPKFTYRGEVREGAVSYTHHLHVPNGLSFFASRKHLSRYADRQNPPLRNIISIEYVGEEECQCIMVDNEDHTYISDDFIPTHNTTCARIFANEINQGKGNPLELDAASNNSVDDVRMIIQQSKTQSLDSEYRVYILDEVHALSNNAWQAMLKILEEPPKKSIFIMCTTNPEKIPKTILSRVQRFDFRRISQKRITDRLLYIMSEENEEDDGERGVSAEAIDYIAKLADGGMRDAITLLEKCLAYSEELTLENVIAALGTVDYEEFFVLTDAIKNRRPDEVIQIVENIYMAGKDLKQFIKDYLVFLLDINKYDITKSFRYMQMPGVYEEQLQHYPDDWFSCCQRLLPVMVKLSADIKWDTQPKTTIEAILLKETLL